jgi:hypothetical protein
MNTKTRDYARPQASGFAASQLIDSSGPMKSSGTLSKPARLPRGTARASAGAQGQNATSGRTSAVARSAPRQERTTVEKPTYISPRMVPLYARMNQI